MVPNSFTACQKLERIEISRKHFAQLNQLQVNDLDCVIMVYETWIYFENPRSAT
jgi:hypothetical protein